MNEYLLPLAEALAPLAGSTPPRTSGLERYTQNAKLPDSIYVSIRAIVLGCVADTLILEEEKICQTCGQLHSLITQPLSSLFATVSEEQEQGRLKGADTADPSKTVS